MILLTVFLSKHVFSEQPNLFRIRNITVFFAIPINQISYDFVDNYKRLSNENPDEFNFRNFFGLIFGIDVPNVTRFSLLIERINLSYIGNFQSKTYLFGNQTTRFVNDNFDLLFFPVGFDYVVSPVVSDYSTYFRFQFGLSFDKLTWTRQMTNFDGTTTEGSFSESTRKFNPFLNFSVGVNFPFDLGYRRSSFLRSFFFETQFNLSLRRFDFSGKMIDEQADNVITILPFYIVFKLGLVADVSSFF